jgi:hypothetical protein
MFIQCPLSLMNDLFDGILDGFPEKRSRSRLEPYGKLIHELLRRGRTYREVASILFERCNLHASISTIHDFVRRPAATARKTRKAAGSKEKIGCDPNQSDNDSPMNSRKSQAAPDEVQQRIAALKFRRAPAQTQPELFQYDPSEPLRVPQKPGSGTK